MSRCSTTRAGWSPCAPGTARSAGAGSSPAGRSGARPVHRCRTRSGSRSTGARWPRTTGSATSAGRWRCSSTATGTGSSARAASCPPMTRSCCASPPPRSCWSSSCRQRSTERSGRSNSTPRTPGTTTRWSWPPVGRSRYRPGRSRCSSERSDRLIPGATYRVQVRPDFDLDAAATLAGYLADLGITHLYSAPLLAAAPGSEHGYDVVDPSRVNPSLGGEAALGRLAEALRDKGLGLVVDIVPNHLGVAAAETNPAWWSVLRDGPASPYASWFDIDWSRGRVLIPVLGDDPQLSIVDGELRYFEHRYPIAPGTEDGTPEEVHD